jgi:hypothetical protein
MSTSGPVQVLVEIERSAATISGSVVVDGAPRSPFFGWLELMDLIERAAGVRAELTTDGDS